MIVYYLEMLKKNCEVDITADNKLDFDQHCHDKIELCSFRLSLSKLQPLLSFLSFVKPLNPCYLIT